MLFDHRFTGHACLPARHEERVDAIVSARLEMK
jgi:hypothetical protein